MDISIPVWRNDWFVILASIVYDQSPPDSEETLKPKEDGERKLTLKGSNMIRFPIYLGEYSDSQDFVEDVQWRPNKSSMELFSLSIK